MVAPCQRFTHRPLLALNFLSVYVHRSTLPQSRFRSTAPSGREPGNAPHNVNHPPAGCCVGGRVIFGLCVGVGTFYHSTGCLRNRGVAGDFRRPYETQKILGFTIHRRTLPQSALRAASSLREGAGATSPQCQSPARWMFCQRAGDFWALCGGTFYHSTGYLRNRGVTGDFHRPYEALKILAFTIQRTTLPQSASLTAPSEREPGWGAYHSTCRPKAARFRAIFIAPTELRRYYIVPFIWG